MKRNTIVFHVLLACISIITYLWGSTATAKVEGTLTIYHAGSLSVPFAQMITDFKSMHPELKVVTKAGGSTKMARLISEKGESADIMASADYMVIDNNLIPGFADWNIRFATNRLVLCYTDKSKMANEVSSENWPEILQNPTVKWGHSDPDLDPCGYRSLMVMQLAENHYKIGGLYEKLLANRPSENVKAKAIHLVKLLQSGDLDYGWEYLSVAKQHGLKYVDLDDAINLGNYQYDKEYGEAHVKVTGKKPGSYIEKKGKSITYGITILKNAANKEAAVAFVEYLLTVDRGSAILEEMGQPPFIPARVPTREMKEKLPVKVHALVAVKS